MSQMRNLVAAILWSLSILPSVGSNAPLFEKGGSVLEVGPDDLNKTVIEDSSHVWLMDYYADWCPHCIHFAPIWTKAADRFKNDPVVRFGALNCAAHGSFCHAHMKVTRFPSLRIYHLTGLKDADSYYGGMDKGMGRTEDGIVNWVRAKISENNGYDPTITTLDPEAAAAAATKIAAKVAGKKSGLRGSSGEKAADGGEKPPAALSQSESAADSRTASDGEKPSAAGSPTIDSLNLPTGGAKGAPKAHWHGAPEVQNPDLRVVDAEIAIMYTFRQGVFISSDIDDNGPILRGAVLNDLITWLELLAALFPSAKAREDIEAVLAFVTQNKVKGGMRQDVWDAWLDGHTLDRVPTAASRDPTGYWRICSTYTCGLWTLFHLLSVAIGELGPRHGFQKSGAPITPGEVVDSVRLFAHRFFGCEECADHFIKTFDSCVYGRCSLDRRDGRSHALWLWQVHNAVTARVGDGAQWPPDKGEGAICEECWIGSSWDPVAVYEFLQNHYWRFEWVTDNVHHGGGELNFIAVFAGVTAAAVMILLFSMRHQLLGHSRKKGL